MDLILGPFADRHVPGFSAEELRQFEEILTHNDPDLYAWVTGAAPVPANFASPLLARLVAGGR